MKRNVKQEFVDAMDELHFSGQEKAAIAENLLSSARETHKSFSGRKLLVLSLAAVLILSTMTAAAVYTRWPKSTEQNYQFSEQEKTEAQKSGLSVLPQETKPSPTNGTPQIVSATDQGITVSVVQTLMDPYHVKMVFRIDGFDLPEGEWPSTSGQWNISISGRSEHPSVAGGFFDGIVERSPDEFTYSDGTPLQQDETGAIILRPVAADGSLEYSVTYAYRTPQSMNTDITARLTGIGIADGVGEPIILVEGSWELSWTVAGSDHTRIVEPNAPIGDSGFTLRRAELSSLTANLEIEGDDSSHTSIYSGEPNEHWIPNLRGVMLKDGTYVPSPIDFGQGDREIEEDVFLANATIQVVDVNQIASLVFYSMDEQLIDGKYVTGEDYIVPIS